MNVATLRHNIGKSRVTLMLGAQCLFSILFAFPGIHLYIFWLNKGSVRHTFV